MIHGMVIIAGVMVGKYLGLHSLLHCIILTTFTWGGRAGSLGRLLGQDKGHELWNRDGVLDREKYCTAKLGKQLYVLGIWNCGIGYQVSFIRRKYIQSSFSWTAYVGFVHRILQVWSVRLGYYDDPGRVCQDSRLTFGVDFGMTQMKRLHISKYHIPHVPLFHHSATRTG